MDAKTKPDAYGALIEPTTLKIQRLLPGPIERIWAYLTDSDLRRKWLAAGAMEMKVGAPVRTNGCSKLRFGRKVSAGSLRRIVNGALRTVSNTAFPMSRT